MRLYNKLCKKKNRRTQIMEQTSQEKMKISKELLDSMLVGVKTQEDLWGKDGIITPSRKLLN